MRVLKRDGGVAIQEQHGAMLGSPSALMVSLTDLRSICTSAGSCAASSVLPTDAYVNINLYKNELRGHLMQLMLSIPIHTADVPLKAAVPNKCLSIIPALFLPLISALLFIFWNKHPNLFCNHPMKASSQYWDNSFSHFHFPDFSQLC